METKRFGFKMKMLPGFREEYKKLHNNNMARTSSFIEK